MSGWGLFWIIVLLAIIGLIAVNAKDLMRYWRIRNM